MLKMPHSDQQAKNTVASVRSFSELGARVQHAPPTPFLRDGFVKLSAADAAAILEQCRYKNQVRDRTPGGRAHIDVLADIMSRGQWRSRDQLDFANVNGCLSLVNGHHRLGAQVQSGAEIEWTIVVHECADDEAVAALYCSFDTNIRVRSNANILAATDLARLLDIKKTTAEALWRAVPLIAAGFDFTRTARVLLLEREVDLRLDMAKKLKGEIQLWDKATDKAPVVIKKRLSTQGALAVALTTFKHKPSRAAEFWKGVADNDGLRKGDPRHTYLRVLQSEIGTQSHMTSPARYAALAWNAFYEERAVSMLKILDNSVFRIAGTPIGRR